MFKDPNDKESGITNLIADISIINTKHNLLKADFTWSNPIKMMEKRMRGLENCLIVAVQPKYIFLKTLTSTYFYSLNYHIKGKSFLWGIVHAIKAFLDVIWDGYLAFSPIDFSTAYREHSYRDWSSMCSGNRSFIFTAVLTIWKNCERAIFYCWTGFKP